MRTRPHPNPSPRRSFRPAALAGTPFAILLLSAAGWTQVTTLQSVGPGGVHGNSASSYPAISPDGRYIVFQSDAWNLVVPDNNIYTDVFVRDRLSGTNDLVSVDSSGVQANHICSNPCISPDGRYVAFHSLATNLVAGDTNGVWDIFVRDRQLGTTERVSVSTSGTQGSSDSNYPAISPDGRYVAFHSYATNLVSGDTNSSADTFVRDRLLGTTERVSVSTSGTQGNGGSGYPTISADGRFVAFDSGASTLVGGDTNSMRDVFVRDRQSGTTERVSVSSSGTQGSSTSEYPWISPDGRWVVFQGLASNLVAGDTNQNFDVFVHDRLTGATELASVSSGGVQGDYASFRGACSADGRYVTMASQATNLVAADTNLASDVFVRDRLSGTTTRVSVSTGGAQGNSHSYFPSVTDDGRYVVFFSQATNLIAGDVNGAFDVLAHDRVASGSTSMCDPGSSGVIACPCSNPPSGSGRGCDNSSATGGASLAASGTAYLSNDTLVFTTQAEKPTATSVVLQGTTSTNGVVFGQGVRCVAGPLKRLYTKTAAGGSISAPVGGDTSVSAQSALLGDPITPGSHRFYQVYYRDPTVVGGCAATSTFNVTQGLDITWDP